MNISNKTKTILASAAVGGLILLTMSGPRSTLSESSVSKYVVSDKDKREANKAFSDKYFNVSW